MNYPVIKSASYALIHAPSMLIHQGTTQTMERRRDPQSKHFKKLLQNMRSFEEAVCYPPNQVFIGGITPNELSIIPRPWYKHLLKDATREGRRGAILEEDEFIGIMKIADAFDLVVLEESFQDKIQNKLALNEVINGFNNCNYSAL